MRSPALTAKVFSVYVLAVGVILIFAPNLLLSLFGFPRTDEVWIRVLGVVVTALGYFYWYAGVANARAFFEASVHGRTFVFLAFLALVALGYAAPQLVLFGVIDLAGAAWTFVALRNEHRGTVPP